jgi:acid phosphatase (class A)
MAHPIHIATGLAVVVAATASVVLLNKGSVLPRDMREAATPKVMKGGLGYLSAHQLPDSVALLPPPPAAGSPAMERDEEARRQALGMRGTPRYMLAAADAVRLQADTGRAFQCALGMEISAERSPALNKVLVRLRLDARAASYPAKSHYLRPRPFVVNEEHTCYPPDEAVVHNDGSYPSARGAVGWAYALVLAMVRPDRKGPILKRGLEFGQSRVVCGLEWQSDVDAARTLGTDVVARTQNVAAFKADLEEARKEVAARLAAGEKAPSSCKTEQSRLASG